MSWHRPDPSRRVWENYLRPILIIALVVAAAFLAAGCGLEARYMAENEAQAKAVAARVARLRPGMSRLAAEQLLRLPIEGSREAHVQADTITTVMYYPGNGLWVLTYVNNALFSWYFRQL